VQDIVGFVAEKNKLWGKAFILLIELCYVDATLTTAQGSNKDLVFTGVQPMRNQTVRVRYVVAGTNTPLSVTVSGGDLTINLATNGAGAATSTASQVMAAVKASYTATALITVMLASGSDGTGVVGAMAFTALAGDQYTRWCRLPSGSGTVSFEGQTWTSFGIGNPVRSQNPHGQIPTFDLQLTNVGRFVQSILENYILEWRPGRLITVHKDYLSDPNAKSEEPFTVITADTTTPVAALTCASVRFNWLRAQIPRKVVTRANYPGVLGSRSKYL